MRPLLRVPPFPGAPPTALTVPESQSAPQLADEELDGLVASLCDTRVGGTYWAARPELPGSEYSLIRVAGDRARDEATGAAAAATALVWAESGSDATITGDCDPWHLLQGAAEVIVDAGDELALIAALAGVPLRCVGEGAFASLAGGGRSALRDAVRRHVVSGWRYVDPFTRTDMHVREAIALCCFWRQLTISNCDITAAVGFAFWKRPTVEPLLWNGATRVPFVSGSRSFSPADTVAMWKSRTSSSLLGALERSGARLIEVEDGFIRSSGLGADCVPPLSILVDRRGIYFDPSRPSELEDLLQNGSFAPETVARARELRGQIVASGVTKYAASPDSAPDRPGPTRTLLVPGQVEDDRSVVSGGGEVRTNLELLRRVREAAPEAYIFYKPHPDVEAGHRPGSVPDEKILSLADEIIRSGSISSIMAVVDEVHVNTSLAGFEALLRGKQVVTYGVPFYAGWGLTRELGPVPSRRTASRTLDELVAAALLIYPRYLDPVTRLPCPAEVLIDRLATGALDRSSGIVVTFRRLQGRVNRVMSGLWTR
ncbi:MAG: capsule biosynthesis protein [Sphingomonas sp.]|nr:capsule biosynthesis protein [Sphingomonas sp.]